MTILHPWTKWLYDKIVLRYPLFALSCVLVVVTFLAYQARHFKLDASEETLVLQTDKDLEYSRLIESRYGEHDYLIITYTPKGDLFSDESLNKISELQTELEQIEHIASVASILNAPLLEDPDFLIKDKGFEVRTIRSANIDGKSAKIEFSDNSLYKNLLISPDLKSTALQVTFHEDINYKKRIARERHLREKQRNERLSEAESVELKSIDRELQQEKEKRKKLRHQDIKAIRKILDRHRSDAEIFLGGVSMIVDDLISFIKNDLMIFGIGVPILLVVILSIIFKNKRYAFLPFLCCAFSILSMVGLLGMFDLQVTVISSNFVSLQLIITMAIIIHLIVRYLELLNNHPDAEQRELVLDTVGSMLTPCSYAALTTIAGFGSLLFCDSLPVITFGWIMSAGIITSLILTFIVFPACLMLLSKKPHPVRDKSSFSLIMGLAGIAEARGRLILIISFLIFIASGIGISRLTVENSFIDYFKEKTEIHKGMKFIDQNLGGTTPLDVIVELDGSEQTGRVEVAQTEAESDEEFEAFEEFDEKADDSKYWFTSDKMALIVKIHDYLDELPETGKVLSLGTLVNVAEKLNKGKPLDNVQLAILYDRLPDKYKQLFMKPYVSPEHNQLRFSVRIKDSDKSLKRNELLKRIREDLITRQGLKEEQVHLTGLMVLYNNMLQSLFNSQIMTIGIVILALMGMFLVLFRSLKLATIAIIPNMLAIASVLGLMGWLKIPLDLMTITIAAISIGIGVDNTIHYIYRFKFEFDIDQDYVKTMYRCHSSIGYALSYTSLTVIVGFSILVLSNFIPSIYFGLLTGLAMFIALIAVLTLLPQLLIIFSPFKHRNMEEEV